MEIVTIIDRKYARYLEKGRGSQEIGRLLAFAVLLIQEKYVAWGKLILEETVINLEEKVFKMRN